VTLASLLTLGATCASEPDGGIHARLAYKEETGLRVVDVPPDGPAWNAGVRRGDRVVAVDGKSVRRMSAEEIVERLRGKAGTEVRLQLQRGAEMVEVTVARAPYR
jgi:carboxyl-terminal processing protease